MAMGGWILLSVLNGAAWNCDGGVTKDKAAGNVLVARHRVCLDFFQGVSRALCDIALEDDVRENRAGSSEK